MAPRRGGSPTVHLFCVPYAGGGVQAFRGWSKELPDWIDLELVALPGRGRRSSEPPARRIAPLAADLADAIIDHVEAPVALFGHSMGALVAFETALALAARGVELRCLTVAACAAPPCMRRRAPLHGLPDDEFIEALADLHGIPNQLMDEPEFRRLALPALRADIEAAETYRPAAGARLDCPILAFGGESDRIVPKDALAGWSAHTDSRFELRQLPGDHFFLHTERPELARALVGELEARKEAVASWPSN